MFRYHYETFPYAHIIASSHKPIKIFIIWKTHSNSRITFSILTAFLHHGMTINSFKFHKETGFRAGAILLWMALE